MEIFNMSFLDAIGRFILLFTNDANIIALVIILGLCSRQSVSWAHAFGLMLFGAVFSGLLKNYYAIPLNESLKKVGYSFPSGHMYTAVSLYGWVVLHTSHFWLRLALITLIAGTGWALVHFGYHILIDVLAALAFVLVTFLICKHLLQAKIFKHNPAFFSMFLMAATLLALLGVSHQTNSPPGKLAACYHFAYTSMIFSSSWLFCSLLFIKRNLQLTDPKSILLHIFRVAFSHLKALRVKN